MMGNNTIGVALRDRRTATVLYISSHRLQPRDPKENLSITHELTWRRQGRAPQDAP